jgi:hypothetical protein
VSSSWLIINLLCQNSKDLDLTKNVGPQWKIHQFLS